MNILRYIKRGFPIQYNNLIAVTPVPGLKFTNWYGGKLSFFFWHAIFSFGFLVALAVNLKFWYQYQFLATFIAYADLQQGVELAFPSVYLCLRYPFDPNMLAKYRKDFLHPNFTMPIELVDSNLQHMFRSQRTAFNVSKKISDSLMHNVDMIWLEKNLDKLFYKVDDLFKDCSFQGKRRECEETFKSIDTSLGQCFAFNSIYTNNSLHENPNNVWYAKMSESDDDWSLRFKIFRKHGTFFFMYLKYPKSLLSLKDFSAFTWYSMEQRSNYNFGILHHLGEEKFRTLNMGYRPCYFPDEKFFDPDLRAEFNSDFHEYGVCLNYCHAQKYKELCSCWPKFAKKIFPKMANKSRICGIKDIECYENSYLAVRQLKCSECSANCNGALYTFNIHSQNEQGNKIYDRSLNSTLELDYFELSIQLDYWPPVHFHIINIFNTTEFILSLASTSCLFLGISVLTFAEAFYNLFIRFPLFYFVNWEYFVKTVRKREEFESKKGIPHINIRLKPGLSKK